MLAVWGQFWGDATMGHAQPGTQPVERAVQAHIDQALSLFAAKEYGAAAREFRRGYEQKPSGDYLYAWAQSERLSGNCAAALPLYEKFLVREPTGANAEVAKINLQRCRTLILATAPPPPPRTIIVTTPAPPAPRDKFYSDLYAGMLVSASALSFGTAVGFRLTANRSAQNLDSAQSYDVYAARADAIKRWDGLATAGVFVGSGLLMAGALRYLWRALR